MDYEVKQGPGTKIVLNPPRKNKIIIPCRPRYDLLEKTYRKHELIIYFKKTPTLDEINKVKQDLSDHNNIGSIKIRQCSCCANQTVQLWTADNIHTVISGDPVNAGSGGGGHTVGEDYSLNFLSKIPSQNKINFNKTRTATTAQKKIQEDLVTIAVLDTGVDPDLVDQNYIGTNLENKDGSPCFKDSKSGQNFVDNGRGKNDSRDDNDHRHGTLVTQYIIDQFEKRKNKGLQIIPVKTHDQDGNGDLFAIYCGIQYAIAKGANIINASWGLYYYESNHTGTIKLFKKLIGELREKGILFITAAGNENTDEDQIATAIYQAQHRGDSPRSEYLRDLATNPFYPACLSEGNRNVITVTTTDGKEVAPKENHSAIFVDLGVKGNNINGDSKIKPFTQFDQPLNLGNPPTFIGGSSFATAIASGVIGATSNRNWFSMNTIDRASFLGGLTNGGLLKKNGALATEIMDGAYIES